PAAPCMKDGKCSRRFPKAVGDETFPEVDGYPIYRRQNDGIKVYKNCHIFTNAHVILYNPILSAKFNCHINVEIATSITAVKYLFKYVYTGYDRAAVYWVNHHVFGNIHEISKYLDSRDMRSDESSSRLYG